MFCPGFRWVCCFTPQGAHEEFSIYPRVKTRGSGRLPVLGQLQLLRAFLFTPDLSLHFHPPPRVMVSICLAGVTARLWVASDLTTAHGLCTVPCSHWSSEREVGVSGLQNHAHCDSQLLSSSLCLQKSINKN